MKPEFMRLRRAIALAIATLLAAAGLAVVSPATAAFAHHNTVTVSASCVDFTWNVTWKITNSETNKSEKIIESNQQALVPVGTVLKERETRTFTERVSGPITKTLTVVGFWPTGSVKDAPRSATIRPADFAGTCAKPTPPPAPKPTPTPSAKPLVTAEAAACVYGNGTATAAVSAKLSGLSTGTKYQAQLWSGGKVVDSKLVAAAASTATASFPGRTPGAYIVGITDAGGKELARSASVTVADCTPITPPPAKPVPVPTVTPLLNAATVPCVEGVPLSAGVAVTASKLSPTTTYFVKLVDDDGAIVTGGAEKSIKGAATQQLGFAGVASTSPVTAVLSTGTARVAVAETPAPVAVPACTGVLAGVITPPTAAAPGQLPTLALQAQLPTLALPGQLPTLAATGPSELLPLGIVAALLLTLGGAVVVTRLRHRTA